MKKIFRKKETESNNFWMSYTDLMSGFLVVFIIISIVSYSKYSSLFDTFKGLDSDEIEQKFTEMSAELDSLKGANLKNLILEYKDVFYTNDAISATFDEVRGSIIISTNNQEKYLFKSGNDNFEPELEMYLNSIYKPLVKKTIQLWNDYNCRNLELRIEGHTDPNSLSGCGRGTNDSFLENLKLSSERANKVYNYILKGDLTDSEREFVKENMISVGYSFSDRVKQKNIDDFSKDPASRRIEFRIITK